MLNKVMLIGRLTKNPEVRYTPTEKVACAFTLAAAKTTRMQTAPVMPTSFRSSLGARLQRCVATHCRKVRESLSKVELAYATTTTMTAIGTG